MASAVNREIWEKGGLGNPAARRRRGAVFLRAI